MKPDHYNRLFEAKLKQIGATKGLYSINSYSEEDFWQQYDKKRYDIVKSKYDPEFIFPNLYQKVMH